MAWLALQRAAEDGRRVRVAPTYWRVASTSGRVASRYGAVASTCGRFASTYGEVASTYGSRACRFLWFARNEARFETTPERFAHRFASFAPRLALIERRFQDVERRGGPRVRRSRSRETRSARFERRPASLKPRFRGVVHDDGELEPRDPSREGRRALQAPDDESNVVGDGRIVTRSAPIEPRQVWIAPRPAFKARIFSPSSSSSASFETGEFLCGRHATLDAAKDAPSRTAPGNLLRCWRG